MKCLARNLLSPRDYLELLNKKTVTEIASYLKHNTSYAAFLDDIRDTGVHRGELEEIIKFSNVVDYIKMSNYLTGDRRKFLRVYLTRFEIDVIKLIMRSINSYGTLDVKVAIPQYFSKKSKVDFDALVECDNMNDLIKRLYGTPYYGLLYTFISKREQLNMFNLEIVLDIYYYKSLTKLTDRYLSKQDYALVMAAFGAEIDLLNISWIYRCKKYYGAAKELIYSFLIPYNYNLSKQQTAAIVESGSINELMGLLEETKYARIFTAEDFVVIEQRINQYVYEIYENQYYTKPFTIAKITSYFHMKQAEINNLIKIIEGIRYQLDANVISRYLVRGRGGYTVGD